MDVLQQINWFLNELTKLPRTSDVEIAIHTTQSAIKSFLGQPYEKYTVTEAKITMDVAGKILKRFAKTKDELDSIDFAVNLSKILMNIFTNQSHSKNGVLC